MKRAHIKQQVLKHERKSQVKSHNVVVGLPEHATVEVLFTMTAGASNHRYYQLSNLLSQHQYATAHIDAQISILMD